MSKKKGLYLSYSQLSTFKECERKWYIDKVLRLRPAYTGSALIFGSALDSAVEHILLKKKGCATKVFLKELDNFNVNGKKKKLPKDLLAVKFFASNIDLKLLKDYDLSKDFKRLGIKLSEYNHKKKSDQEMFLEEFLEYCKQQRRLKEPLEESDQILFNTLAYRTIQISGEMFIETLQEWITENVKEVHAVQKKVEIDDGNGNKFVGYLDFVVTLKDGRKLLIDLKSSSNPSLYYPEGCASNSSQLGIYAQEEGLVNVAYLVIDKNVRVKEPRVRIHFIEGEITDDKLDEVFNEIEDCVDLIYEKIELGIGAFDKNKETCSNFGGCQYGAYCWKGSKEGLEEV